MTAEGETEELVTSAVFSVLPTLILGPSGLAQNAEDTGLCLSHEKRKLNSSSIRTKSHFALVPLSVQGTSELKETLTTEIGGATAALGSL